ncbi:MAG TPA: hypothetical protein VNG51_12405 [Ktedonobacteraceae bacterium]|nr:hypothetical protein [Ktedonobacteraceae bacterium]
MKYITDTNLVKIVIAKTLRVPAVYEVTSEEYGNQKLARQFDAALLSVGFKADKELMKYLDALHPTVAMQLTIDVLDAVKTLVGDHVKHNVYFKEFPKHIPDTIEFWRECIVDALHSPDGWKVAVQLEQGYVNLLDLPKYGKYLHSYKDMVAAHDKFIESAKDRITILSLGETLPEEVLRVYTLLASSRIPLNETDRALLGYLAELCIDDPQPEKVPVHENKAIINKVRISRGHPLIANTVTDILRVAVALSDGDITLQEKTKFTSFKRRIRKELLAVLDHIVGRDTGRLLDVSQYAEEWKRLGERLHPHEYAFSHAQDVFAVARGEKVVFSLPSQVETALQRGDIDAAITVLKVAPGRFVRSIDRLLRVSDDQQTQTIIAALEDILPKVSGRVMLSLREHLQNREIAHKDRIYINSKGKAYVDLDKRDALSRKRIDDLLSVLDKEVTRRFPVISALDSDIHNIAIPLSNKNQANGFRIFPRGSITAVKQNQLRFFVYWKQYHERTDYDLSVLFLDKDFTTKGHASYTNLRGTGYRHSGDITSAPAGASEFIDISLDRVDATYIVPQVNIFSGEDFLTVEETFFGYMEISEDQQGLPFEPRTVQMKSDVHSKGRIALPIIFCKNDDGSWFAKWMHLFLKGSPRFNRVEGNHLTTAMLVRSIVERQYLTIGYLETLTKKKAATATYPTYYVGIDAPKEAPVKGTLITLNNLSDLIP